MYILVFCLSPTNLFSNRAALSAFGNDQRVTWMFLEQTHTQYSADGIAAWPPLLSAALYKLGGSVRGGYKLRIAWIFLDQTHTYSFV